MQAVLTEHCCEPSIILEHSEGLSICSIFGKKSWLEGPTVNDPTEGTPMFMPGGGCPGDRCLLYYRAIFRATQHETYQEILLLQLPSMF